MLPSRSATGPQQRRGQREQSFTHSQDLGSDLLNGSSSSSSFEYDEEALDEVREEEQEYREELVELWREGARAIRHELQMHQTIEALDRRMEAANEAHRQARERVRLTRAAAGPRDFLKRRQRREAADAAGIVLPGVNSEGVFGNFLAVSILAERAANGNRKTPAKAASAAKALNVLGIVSSTRKKEGQTSAVALGTQSNIPPSQMSASHGDADGITNPSPEPKEDDGNDAKADAGEAAECDERATSPPLGRPPSSPSLASSPTSPSAIRATSAASRPASSPRRSPPLSLSDHLRMNSRAMRMGSARSATSAGNTTTNAAAGKEGGGGVSRTTSRGGVSSGGQRPQSSPQTYMYYLPSLRSQSVSGHDGGAALARMTGAPRPVTTGAVSRSVGVVGRGRVGSLSLTPLPTRGSPAKGARGGVGRAPSAQRPPRLKYPNEKQWPDWRQARAGGGAEGKAEGSGSDSNVAVEGGDTMASNAMGPPPRPVSAAWRLHQTLYSNHNQTPSKQEKRVDSAVGGEAIASSTAASNKSGIEEERSPSAAAVSSAHFAPMNHSGTFADAFFATAGGDPKTLRKMLLAQRLSAAQCANISDDDPHGQRAAARGAIVRPPSAQVLNTNSISGGQRSNATTAATAQRVQRECGADPSKWSTAEAKAVRSSLGGHAASVFDASLPLSSANLKRAAGVYEEGPRTIRRYVPPSGYCVVGKFEREAIRRQRLEDEAEA